MSYSRGGGSYRSKIQKLIEKTSDYDKDERYMATLDICTELGKDGRQIDGSLELRICAAVLRQLDDTHTDVQSIAVKCLSILVEKAQEEQVVEICTTLTRLLLSKDKALLRDIYAIALRQAIQKVPASLGPTVVSSMAAPLIRAVKPGAGAAGAAIQEEALEVLKDLIERFGGKSLC